MLPAVRPVHENSNTGDECGDLIEYCSGRGFDSRHLHHFEKDNLSPRRMSPRGDGLSFFPRCPKGFRLFLIFSRASLHYRFFHFQLFI